MGNNTSTTSERQQGFPSSKVRGAAAEMPGGRERDQSALPPADVPKMAVARYTAPQSNPQSRIVVDIRSSNLDKDYNVYIKQEPQRDLPVDIASAWSGLQAIGALCITVLTIQKLWEDIKFIRLLRRELSTLVGSLTDAAGGLDAGSGDGAPRKAHTRGGCGRQNSSCSGSPARQLDLHLNELSELLGAGNRGTATAQERHQEQQGTANANVAAAAAALSSGNGNLAGTAHLNNSTTAHTATSDAGPSPALMRKETTWSSISGLLEVKMLLQEATVLPTLRPDLFQGIRQPPKALLLFGPPGTGKTLLARAVATESRATFLPVTGSSVLSMWYGQSEQNVKALFEKARKRQPAIIFIDEVDSLLGKRSSGGPRDSTPDKRVTNEFLAFIDGIQTQQAQQGPGGGGDGGDNRIVVIAATNTPWDLDEAALSRFSRRIYVPLPDRGTREALMRKAMEGIACDVSDSAWQRLAERCDKYSGRDLVQVCREAAMRPLRELWGRCLLEGSPAPHDSDSSGPAVQQQTAAAQQRLVELVANSLAVSAASKAGGGPTMTPTAAAGRSRSGTGGIPTAAATSSSSSRPGGPPMAPPAGWLHRFGFRWGGFGGNRYARSKKQARRELERWKRRHGATWCNVDLIMEQAEGLLESRSGSEKGRGEQPQADGRPEGKADGEAPAEGTNAGEQHQQQQQHQGQGQGEGDADPGRQQQQQQQQEGASGTDAAPPATCISAEATKAEEAARNVCVRVQLQVLRASAVEEDGRAGNLSSGAPVQVRLQIQDGASATEGGNKSAAAECAVANTPAAEAASATAASTADASAALRRLSSSRGVTGGTRSSAAGSCVPAGAPGPAAATTRSNAAAAARGAASSRVGAEEGGSALSLEGLLALPATRVRPVTAADLEAALQVISCTEMDQTARYTEWDEQYGSGANQSGRQGGARGKVWMSMYA